MSGLAVYGGDMSDPTLSQLVAASETSRFGAPWRVEKDGGCAPFIWFRNKDRREVARVDFYGVRALVACAGEPEGIRVLDYRDVRAVLDAAYARLEAKGMVP